jgi:Retinoblastoma-associated protein A domain/Retinoblastoma-associated protein B domain/Domain of unknown function (DUF3452)
VCCRFASACYLCGLSDPRFALTNGNRLGLSELARAGGLRLVDMFQSLKGLDRLVGGVGEQELKAAGLSAVAGARADWEAHIRMLERKFVITSILFQKLVKVYLLSEPGISATGSAAGFSIADSGFQAVWLLFLVAKTRLLRDPPDLVNSFQLLLCSLGVVLSLLGDQSAGATPSDRLAGTLHHLCARLGADFTQVQDLYTNHFAPLLQLLCNRGSLPEAMLHGAEGDDSSAPPPPVDTLTRSLESLSHEYNSLLSTSWYLDERIFLEPGQLSNPEGSGAATSTSTSSTSTSSTSTSTTSTSSTGVASTSSTSASTAHYTHTDSVCSSSSSSSSGVPSSAGSSSCSSATSSPSAITSLPSTAPPSTPPRPLLPRAGSTGGPLPPSTPISTSMGLLAWLKHTLAAVPAEPSAVLDGFLRECRQPNVRETIVQRVEELLTRVRTLGKLAPADDSEERLRLGVRLYYRIMQQMLVSEEKRLKARDFTALLAHDNFHRSLLATCLEVVFFCYQMQHRLFPYLLERFELNGFHLFKLLENVILHEKTLPRSVVHHLLRVEEAIVEEWGWRAQSPLYELLAIDACAHSLLDQYSEPTQTSAAAAAAAAAASSFSTPQRRCTSQTAHGSALRDGGSSLSATPNHHSHTVASFPTPSTAGIACGKLAAEQPQQQHSAASAGKLSSSVPAVSTSASNPPSTDAAVIKLTVSAPPSTTAGSKATPSRLRLGGGAAAVLSSPARTPRRLQLTTGNFYSVDRFFRKLVVVAWTRTTQLCNGLVAHRIFLQVWRALVRALVKRPALMRNRHLDQLILCTVYGVSRVNHLSQVTFRTIVNRYRRRLSGGERVYRQVPLSDADPMQAHPTTEQDERNDIIKFYNQVYVSLMEDSMSQYRLAPSESKSSTAPSLSAASAMGVATPPLVPSSTIPPPLQSMSPRSFPQSPLRVVQQRVTAPRSPLLTSGTPRGLSFRIGQSPRKVDFGGDAMFVVIVCVCVCVFLLVFLLVCVEVFLLVCESVCHFPN